MQDLPLEKRVRWAPSEPRLAEPGPCHCHHRNHQGYTLIELMIVLTIISILVTIALPIANAAILRTKEAVLKSNLFTLRSLIDQYTADKLKAPQSLQDLVTAGYLRAIPKDPITGSADTWQTVTEESTILPEQTEVGIYDIHSGSSATSSEGTPYNTW
jgi:general secretion pathway protein G